MAKKRFTAGMESLFGEAQEPKALEQESLLSDNQEKTTKRLPKKKATKGFRADLKAFLQEAFEESFEQQLEEKKNKSKPSNAKKINKPKGGLDALLRSTIEPSKIKLHNKPVRRLTISFEERKLEKLKRIARLEKIYLKDIIDDIVGEFIEEYESGKGPIK